ncbi:hypothetical protein [Delftia acidovorans]|uniref:hypothetical protein n=1 Tax=Delftia acidovorans TaxID=80866 RepID=UPI0005C1DBCC|nr:hypothetical protein [Delftia acidovorans]QPS73993.1 hypothetical protein I6G48_25680 [Delftia acidovorans]
MPYTTLQDIETLADALTNARAVSKTHLGQDDVEMLELRVQQSIDELVAGGTTADDQRLVRLRSL